MAKLIAPSILSADFSKLGLEVEAVLRAGADWIHVDVMDGHFVPNLTIGAPVLKSLRKNSQAFFDVHLMIENPERWVCDYLEAGADLVTVHIESTKNIDTILEEIKRANKKSGISLKPKTPVSSIESVLDKIDLVLVMTVEPGFGGQSFMHDQLQKISELKRIREEKKLSFLIEVDGGINEETAKLCSESGADVFVAGSYIFSKDYSVAVDSLRF